MNAIFKRFIAKEDIGIARQNPAHNTVTHITDYCRVDFAEGEIIVSRRAGEDARGVGAEVESNQKCLFRCSRADPVGRGR